MGPTQVFVVDSRGRRDCIIYAINSKIYREKLMIRMNSHKTVLMPKSLEDNQVQMDNICKAFNNGSASDAAASIGQLFRCRGMSQVSMASGIGRAVLYRSFGKSGNPTLQVLLDSLRAVGLTLVVAEAKDR